MKLSRLEKAWTGEFETWLSKKLELTPRQQDVLRYEEAIRFSKFEIYKRPDKVRVLPLWRLTLPLFLIYAIIIIVFNPIKWMVTGEWGYSSKFMNGFHYPWVRKLNLD